MEAGAGQGGERRAGGTCSAAPLFAAGALTLHAGGSDPVAPLLPRCTIVIFMLLLLVWALYVLALQQSPRAGPHLLEVALNLGQQLRIHYLAQHAHGIGTVEVDLRCMPEQGGG